MGLFSAISSGLGIASSLFGGGGSNAPDIPAFEAERIATSEEARDVLRAAGLAADFNTGEAVDNSIAVTNRFNDQILADVMNAIGEQFGGNIPNQQAVGVVTDQLSGNLSQGTQQLLARRAAESGAAALGRSAVYDANTHLLGITAEQQAQQGLAGFSNLYSLFRQSVNPFRPEQALGYTGIAPGQAIQGALSGAQLQYQYDSTAYNAAIGQATAQFQQNQGVQSGIGALGAGLDSLGRVGGIGSAVSSVFSGGLGNSIFNAGQVARTASTGISHAVIV